MSTFEFEDQSRIERLTGTLHAPGATTGDVLTVNADKSISPAPSGGSQPVTDTWFGNGIDIGNGASASLTWDNLGSGPGLLDITDPANPAVKADGTYALIVTVSLGAGLTAAGFYAVIISLDANGANFQLEAESPPSAAALNTPQIVVPAIYPLLAGQVINVQLQNKDGASTRNYGLGNSTVTKLG